MNLPTLSGDVDRPTAARFAAALGALSPPPDTLTLDFSDVDLSDAVATTTLINAIRTVAQAGCAVRLLEPPQVLAHGLYRVAALENGRIELVAPREEIGPAG